AHDGIEGFMGARKGSEMSDRYAAGPGEGQMLAPPGRRNPPNQSRKLVKIRGIDALGAAEGQLKPVRDQREMVGQQVELVELLRRRVEIVVGRYLKEIDLGALAEQIGPK